MRHLKQQIIPYFMAVVLLGTLSMIPANSTAEETSWCIAPPPPPLKPIISTEMTWSEGVVIPRLDPEIEKALHSLNADPAPESITRGMHYVVSNELRHYILSDIVKDKRGIHIGVGAEQNYILAGWSKPDIIILMDFDQYIVDLHKIYQVFFETSWTPEEFVDQWKSKNKERSIQRIREAHQDNPVLAKKLVSMYKFRYRRVQAKFREILGIYKEEKRKCFLNDYEQFSHIKRLVETGRVVQYRGNLTGDKFLNSLAKFSNEYGIHIGTLYMSNAEYYFPFATGNFISNMMSQTFGDEGLVIHTHPYSGVEYQYIYHRGVNFQEWLTSRKVKTLRRLKDKYGTRQKDSDLIEISRSPKDKK